MLEGTKAATTVRTLYLGRTMAASAVFALVAAGFAWYLTSGFEAWTFDDRRVLAMNAGKITAKLPTLLTSERQAFVPRAKQRNAVEVYLVDFIYTSCPTVCQVLGSEFYRMQQRLKDSGSDSSVRLLSVSIDMRRDVPEQLASYAKRHMADGKTWLVGVPISASELEATLRDLQVVVVDDGFGGYVHNGTIHMLDSRGNLLGLYEYDQWQQAVEEASEIARASL